MTTTLVCSSSGIQPKTTCCSVSGKDSHVVADCKSASFAGRSVSTLKSGVSSLANGISAFAHRTIIGISEVASDTNAVASFYRKLEKHVVNFIEVIAETPGKFTKMADCIRKAVSFIDFCQFAGDLNYFLRGGYKEARNDKGELVKEADNKVIIGARVAMAAADIGGTLLWFEEMGFYKLKNIAESIGGTRVFSFVPKVVASIPVVRDVSIFSRAANALGNLKLFGCITKASCLFVTLRALDLMYGLFAVDAAKRLVNAPTSYHRISAGLDLTSCISELVISALIFAGVTNVIGLGIAGTVGITMAVSSFLYRNSHSEELKLIEKKAV